MLTTERGDCGQTGNVPSKPQPADSFQGAAAEYKRERTSGCSELKRTKTIAGLYWSSAGESDYF